jgi:hypothetical protein
MATQPAPTVDELLAVVRRRVRAQRDAVARLEQAVHEASAAGASLRDIADVAAVSHMTVRRILAGGGETGKDIRVRSNARAL